MNRRANILNAVRFESQDFVPMTLKLICSLMLLLCCPFLAAAESCLTIVHATNASPTEQYALEELKACLERVGQQTGKPVAVIAQQEGAPLPAADGVIYLGPTAFAAANGLADTSWGAEAWRVKSIGNNLVLTGGRPRGTLYAVYNYLERVIGVHWFEPGDETIMPQAAVRLTGIDLAGEPQAIYRTRHTGVDALAWDTLYNNISNTPVSLTIQSNRFFLEERAFRVRNRCPGMSGIGPHFLATAAERGGRELFSRDGGFQEIHPFIGHTFYRFISPGEYWAKHPEYFGFQPGKAPAKHPDDPQYHSGMLCLSSPEVRKLMIEKVSDYMAGLSNKVAAAGLEPPKIIGIGQMDRTTPCGCDGCRAFVKQHGEESDLLIDFLNEISDALVQKYPDLVLETLTYTWSLKPPRTIRPRPNLLFTWCNWGWPAAFGGDGSPKLDQPLTHPDNAARLTLLKQWSALGARLFIWDYQFLSSSLIPLTSAPYAAENFRTALQLGAKGFFYQENLWSPVEQNLFSFAHHGPWHKENFPALRAWMCYQLLADERQDIKQLEQLFFDGYYGPAAAPMAAFYRHLVSNQQQPRLPRQLFLSGATLDYLTGPFFTACHAYLDEARRLAAGQRKYELRVMQEGTRLDLSTLELWGDLERRHDGRALPWNRAELVRRWENECRMVSEERPWVIEDKKEMLKWSAQIIDYHRQARFHPLVSNLAPAEWMDISWRPFPSALAPFPIKGLSREHYLANDRLAAFGSVSVFRDEKASAFSNLTVRFSGAQPLSKAFTVGELGNGQSYTLIKVGTTRLLSTNQSAVLDFTLDGQQRFGGTTAAFDLMRRVPQREAAARWDVYVSVKPVWANPQRTLAKELWLERILLVRAEPGAERPAEEQAWYERYRRAAPPQVEYSE
jgi:hypothetical protein